MKLSFDELRHRVGAPQPTSPQAQAEEFAGLLDDEKPKKRFYMEGDRLASFVEDFEKAIDAEKTDAQFLRSWAALVDFEGSQEETVPGMLEFFTPQFRFWSTLGLAGLYVLVRRLGKIKRKPKPQYEHRPQESGPGAQAEAESKPDHPVSPRASVAETTKPNKSNVCEICQVELIPMGEHSGQCPSCQHIYFRKMEE